jgi:hypothetical protein
MYSARESWMDSFSSRIIVGSVLCYPHHAILHQQDRDQLGAWRDVDVTDPNSDPGRFGSLEDETVVLQSKRLAVLTA